MTIRFQRLRRGRERGFAAAGRELEPPIELPPRMWLPAPETAQGETLDRLRLGALKPQREAHPKPRATGKVDLRQSRGGTGPLAGYSAGERRTKRGRLGMVAGIGATGGVLLFLAALELGHTSAAGDPADLGRGAVTDLSPSGVNSAEGGSYPGTEGLEIALWVTATPTEAGGVSAAELAAAAPASAPPSRWQMPLKAWSAVTDRFGAPRGNGVLHGGIDLALDGMRRSPVYPACEGTVATAGYSAVYGNHVVVDCGDGWSTLYGHFSETRVGVGQAVGFEEVIGISGTSGQAQGEHLHFEIRWLGTAVNPENYLDFGIPAGRPLTYDRRDANGNLITPEPPSTPTATMTPTATLTPTPTNTPTPRPTKTAAEEATAKAINGAVRR